MRKYPDAMSRSSPWWQWVQRNLDALGWRPADLAHAIRNEVGDGPDESVIGRWKNKGATPTLDSVRAVAQVFHTDIRQAIIASGLMTARELNAAWPEWTEEDLARQLPDDVLLEEVRARLSRRRRQPASRPRSRAVTPSPERGPDRTTISPSSHDGDSTTVVQHPLDKAETPPSHHGDEGAEASSGSVAM